MARITALLLSVLVPAALASPNPPQTPPIQVTTHLVEIGVIVRDNNGPVANLTKEDFVILDRGKPRNISFFSLESGNTRSAPAPPWPRNTFSDQPQYGTGKPRSVTIVLLDNLNTLFGSAPQAYETTPFWFEDHALANAKQHLLEFIKQMDPDDRLAIYGLTDSIHVLCDFTCGRDPLLAVVAKYDAASKTQRETVEAGQFTLPNTRPEFNHLIDADSQRLASLNNQARAQITMAALTAIANHVIDIPGRKNLLWLTANLPFSGRAIAHILTRANIAAYPLDARGLLPRSPSVSNELDPLSSPGVARVRSALGLDDNAVQTDEPVGVDAMEQIAEETGGRAFINTNDLTGAIRHAVEDSAATYTLGFYIDSHSLDGKFHELRVQVQRSGLNLRYPKAYLALKDEPVTQDERRNNFLVAIKSPLDSAAIPIEIRVDRLNQSQPNFFTVSGSIGIHGVHFSEANKVHVGALEVTLLEQDQTGKILHESTHRLNLRFSEEKYSAVLKSGINFREPVRPQNGATTLRVLVQDPATAAIGSLIIPLSQVN